MPVLVVETDYYPSDVVGMYYCGLKTHSGSKKTSSHTDSTNMKTVARCVSLANQNLLLEASTKKGWLESWLASSVLSLVTLPSLAVIFLRSAHRKKNQLSQMSSYAIRSLPQHQLNQLRFVYGGSSTIQLNTNSLLSSHAFLYNAFNYFFHNASVRSLILILS